MFLIPTKVLYGPAVTLRQLETLVGTTYSLLNQGGYIGKSDVVLTDLKAGLLKDSYLIDKDGDHTTHQAKVT